MEINEQIVLNIEKETNCPIKELFYTAFDNQYYVRFEQYYYCPKKNINFQTTNIDKVMNIINKYNNVKNITHECFDDEIGYYEMLSFEWKKQYENID